jgi:general secretion pathway protein E/type IV pilus assembly protein PilB
MVDMGVEPFLVASTVEAVMAQRLVRRLCDSCKTEYRPSPDDLPNDFPFERMNEGEMFQPTGCRKCRQSGYTGRMGIYELMVTSDEVRQLAHDRVSTWKLKAQAVKDGMRTLRDDGWLKVLKGKTSVDEILRVSKGDQQFTLEH